jgi:hypothetical protein
MIDRKESNITISTKYQANKINGNIRQHLSLITQSVNGLNSPIKTYRLAE